jgi:sodium/potassium/calcium exchanger 6
LAPAGFLFACLLGSLVAVPLSGFRITRSWGICLIALYVLFMVVSVLIETRMLDIGY